MSTNLSVRDELISHIIELSYRNDHRKLSIDSRVKMAEKLADELLILKLLGTLSPEEAEIYKL